MSSKRIVQNITYVNGYRITSRSILDWEDAIKLFMDGRVSQISKTSKVNLNTAYNGYEPRKTRRKILGLI